MASDLDDWIAAAGHSELGERTGQVIQLQSELTTLRASLRVIHQPFEGRCSECVEGCDCPGEHTCTHDNVPWPCRTAVAAGISENISPNATGGER